MMLNQNYLIKLATRMRYLYDNYTGGNRDFYFDIIDVLSLEELRIFQDSYQHGTTFRDWINSSTDRRSKANLPLFLYGTNRLVLFTLPRLLT